MNMLLPAIALAAMVLPLSCPAFAEDPGERMATGAAEPPNAAAPTEEELRELFYRMAPEHAGKELVVRYEVVSEDVWKKRGGVCHQTTGQCAIGCASVNTLEFYRLLEQRGGRILGGGTLRVRFELESGRIIGRPLREK